MNRNMLAALGLLILVVIVIWLSYVFARPKIAKISNLTPQMAQVTESPTPTPVPTPITEAYCMPKDLDAMVNLDHAAGNVYGTLTITNKSIIACKIEAQNYIRVVPNKSVKNIQISKTATSSADFYLLPPHQSAYALIHYPNGPQCNGPTVSTSVQFIYQIAPSVTITFDQTGTNQFLVQTCKSPDEITEIRESNMSNKPITNKP